MAFWNASTPCQEQLKYQFDREITKKKMDREIRSNYSDLICFNERAIVQPLNQLVN